MNKSIIRKDILSLRNKLKKEEKNKSDEIIFDLLVKSSMYKKANKIYIYISYNNEVDTNRIIKYSLNNNKIIYVPKINLQNKTMKAVRIHNFSELIVNKYGILEPSIVDKNNIGLDFDLIIMPGVAFDKDGNRIGYGGGYYDKYISHLSKDINKVALAYSFQLVNNIEAEEHDIKVNYIITDKKIIYI